MMVDKSTLLFLPIDLPPMPIDIEKVKSFRYQQSTDNTFGERFFRTVFLRGIAGAGDKSAYRMYDDTLDWQWNKIAATHFPEVIESVESLPFSRITMVTFVSLKNNQPMPPHHDYPSYQLPRYVIDNEPYSYRVSIGDTKDSFYVSTKQGINDDELDTGRYLFGNLPASTNHWCMSVTNALHSTLPKENKETLFISGILDPKAHDELINRSYEKYAEHAITVDRLKQEGRKLREIIPTPWTDLKERHPELYDVTKGS